MKISPQAALMLAGFGFRGGKLSRFVVLRVSPREAVGHHLHVDEAVAQVDAADLTLVPINVGQLDAHGLVCERMVSIDARLRETFEL